MYTYVRLVFIIFFFIIIIITYVLFLVPLHGMFRSCGTLPDPIFTSPLCWINIVSQVRFPWMMGGEHECK